jgi:hypothetical protein
MSDEVRERRLCPTPKDGGHALIAHLISLETCQERQRRMYHKCYSCVHANGAGHRVANVRGLLERLKSPAPSTPLVVQRAASSADRGVEA